MNIIDFINYFPNEESCEIYLKAHREKLGYAVKAVKLFPNLIGSAVLNFSNVASADAGVLLKAVR